MSHESCASNVNNEISILEVRSPSRRWRHSTLRGALSIGSRKPMRPLAEILTREGGRSPSDSDADVGGLLASKGRERGSVFRDV